MTDKSRVLVVEDTPLNMKLVSDVLEASGYEVLQAVDAETGIVLARTEHVDIVLMDIELPGMSGLEALGVLKGDDKTATIPVMAVTASAEPQERAEIIAAGFDGYQPKPISLKQLLAEVASLLGGSAGGDDGAPG